MRKSIDTLCLQLVGRSGIQVMDSSLYVFCNKRQTIIKVLYYDKNGFCLFQKRLDKEHFDWPSSTEQVKKMQVRELRWILDGLRLCELKPVYCTNKRKFF